MKKFILQLGKESAACNNVEEAKEFIGRFGHLTSAGEKRITGLFNGTIDINRDFAWMMPKHIPELKDYPEQSCRMWVKPIPENNHHNTEQMSTNKFAQGRPARLFPPLFSPHSLNNVICKHLFAYMLAYMGKSSYLCSVIKKEI